MKKTIIFLFIASSGWSACPLYQYNRDPQLNQEIQNICSNITNPVINGETANTITMNGGFQLKALTLSQMQSMTPLTGQEYYCSNCSTDSVCISTAAVKGSFSRLTSRTTICS
jgi:hypothetical protein